MRKIHHGSKIAIVSPSGTISDDFLFKAVANIEAEGYKVEIMPHVTGHSTSVFSAKDNERSYDLREAILSDDIDAIICARGGYGAVRTLQSMGLDVLQWCDKWLVGFSDITVLHSGLTRIGHKSIHGPMLKHIAEHGMHSPDVEKMFSVMKGETPLVVECQAAQGSRDGLAEGIVTGGNLSIIYSLRGTPDDITPDGKILFLEDLNEYNYHIDRMIQNLKYSGYLERISGLILGQFTGMKDGATSFGKEAVEIITDAVKEYNYPVLTGYPAGHAQEINMPLIMGARARLNVKDGQGSITWE